MPNTWSVTITRLVVALVAGALIGWWYGSVAAGLFAAAMGLLAWHLYHLYKLDRWLKTNDLEDFPTGLGIWPDTFARVSFFRGRARRRGKRLRALLKEFRLSASAFPDAGVILNSDNDLLYFNKAARELLGLKKKSDRGQRIENLIRVPAFLEYLRNGDFSEPGEFQLLPSLDVWVSCRIVPYGPEQRLVVLQDISRSKRLETMRRDFLANASHELRTPLTVITGYLDTLEGDEGLPDYMQHPLTEMNAQAARMRTLLEDLLRLSELESSELSSREERVDVAALTSAAKQSAKALEHCPDKVEVKVNSGIGILGVHSELQSVISNLVVNAVNHTERDGRIEIHWDADDEGGRLSVVDSGIGIDEDDIPRLTERFYRIDAGRSRDKGGTGLGLAIVKHALIRHEAELEIDSTPGIGSRFTCIFPPNRLA